MTDQAEAPQTPSTRATRRSTRVVDLMNSPTSRKTPLGTDTAWALKLRDAVNAAVRELHVQVLSAKPVTTYTPDDSGDMLIEMETDRGRVEALRSKTGAHAFRWL